MTPPHDSDRSHLEGLIARIVESYHAHRHTQHLDATFLPSRARTVEVIEVMRRIVFPGFFDDRRLTGDTISYHIGDMLLELRTLLYEQVRAALRYTENQVERGRGDACDHCDEKAKDITEAFLERIPEIRRLLATDVAASFDGDPAASNTDETIFCYPGVDAIFTYRVAHELYNLGVPLVPRMMTEYAHNETGIDIHPGAQIGESFFIDHGTGVVIGETCVIGKRVKLYQGVTLGALSTKGGQAWRGRKRHPTIEDDVTIYANAIILGGETVIGEGCVVNGSVFITRSVPPHHTVGIKEPELTLRSRPRKKVAR